MSVNVAPRSILIPSRLEVSPHGLTWGLGTSHCICRRCAVVAGCLPAPGVC
ncbi:uncharacterized protein LACBIDRAFT_314699 [Laccaria bicolor S238N-H82]|uniref:Predicted protein n=1 Tax=Laccaria bicolor (strain S238N-H82 / ATCC MYA-4686) TaxID=486041 RepID=B0DZ19_LACBS|nr:uncharacterized protein LACBIDRAFT_314699 [Laccaria bicolor S238N-H82]EDR00117.1 predicted protein [Laccaria bicolor S238N-H82]|eukprot:XP_001889174.1 predicted protein [Laccaria bicolor S238N-H82]